MAVRERKQTAQALLRRLPRLLVVDPAPASARQLSQLLQGWGAVTAQASTPEAALAALSQRRFEMILLSLHMPGLNGVEMIAEVRRGGANSTTPVIALTSAPRSPRVKRALEAGANDALALPSTVRSMARLCWYWLKLDQYPSARNVKGKGKER
jgi:two-component system, sensor histidine kinase